MVRRTGREATTKATRELLTFCLLISVFTMGCPMLGKQYTIRYQLDSTCSCQVTFWNKFDEEENITVTPPWTHEFEASDGEQWVGFTAANWDHGQHKEIEGAMYVDGELADSDSVSTSHADYITVGYYYLKSFLNE